MLEFRYDTQLLIEGTNLNEDEINEWITTNLKGDCLLAVGDEEMIKIHFHTNEPWDLLKYASTLGEIFDIVVEDMERQSQGKRG
ncbi:MAG: kinase to dihydroxyacetone kinase [Bacilli bacterium]